MVKSGLSEIDATALACTLGGERLGYFVFMDKVEPEVIKPIVNQMTFKRPVYTPQAGELF